MTAPRIDHVALTARLEAINAIGRQPDGSCRRLALTEEDRLGRDLVAGWMRELGMAVTVDRIGNIVGVLAGAEDLSPVITGSHIDTVATGGRFDGTYGVLAGLEAAAAIRAAGAAPRRPIAVAAFTNEEGVRFQPDMMGSLVYAGGLAVEDALAATDRDGAVLGDELARIGYAGDEAPGGLVPHVYVELHIEQGPVLDRAGEALGVVVDLQGISWTEATIAGTSNHAGTTPMFMRRDAGLAAAEIVVFLRRLAGEMGGAQVATAGSLSLEPNLINVIPRKAVLSIDLRNTDEGLLQEAEARLEGFLADLAAAEGVEIATRRLARFEPVTFDEGVAAAIEAEAAAMGRPIRRMTSGAGHDAQMMARICPAAMIFVPSIGGVSHNPREDTAPDHLALGADLLLRTLLRLAS